MDMSPSILKVKMNMVLREDNEIEELEKVYLSFFPLRKSYKNDEAIFCLLLSLPALRSKVTPNLRFFR